MTAGGELELAPAPFRARARKALVAAGTAFLTALGASLWSSASGSPLSREEIAGAVALAVLAAVSTGLAAFGVKNAGQLDLSTLDVVTRRAVLDALAAYGPKPAHQPAPRWQDRGDDPGRRPV